MKGFSFRGSSEGYHLCASQRTQGDVTVSIKSNHKVTTRDNKAMMNTITSQVHLHCKIRRYTKIYDLHTVRNIRATEVRKLNATNTACIRSINRTIPRTPLIASRHHTAQWNRGRSRRSEDGTPIGPRGEQGQGSHIVEEGSSPWCMAESKGSSCRT